MNRRVFGLSLTLLVWIVACGVPPRVFTSTPTQTPDRVATRVAEEKAVAATLTAEAPKATQTPLSTPTSISPPTITPWPTRPGTPTGTDSRFPQAVLIQGSMYGIKVVSVEKTDWVQYSVSSFGAPQYTSPDPGNIFLKIGVAFYKSGEPLWEVAEWYWIFVEDSNGEVYPISFRPYATEGLFNPTTLEFTPTHYSIVFSVPKTSTGFAIRYKDLPAIDLGFPTASALTPMPLATVAPIPKARLTPQTGKWRGMGTFQLEGKERAWILNFAVSEDAKQVREWVVAYCDGKCALDIDQKLPAMLTTLPLYLTFDGNAFYASVQDDSSPATFPIGPIKVVFKGTFISPTSLEGTFKSAKGSGKWTAQPWSK